jgi:tetratricopeptide (TPR) repeat protein
MVYDEDYPRMEANSNKPFFSRPPVILAVLAVVAVAGLAGVDQLVKLYRVQIRRLGKNIYNVGLLEQQAGHLQRAVEDFRAALNYEPDNDQYQLSLGRALRDSNHFGEAESYLLSLWQRTPQDSTINLALARLAARRDILEDALRYYHNAIYGVWKSNPDANRQLASFELIELLLQKNALQQAQSELIGLLSTLPKDPALHLRVAEMLSRAQDYNRALGEFQFVLQKDRHNAAALFGAGQAAFQLGRYRTAQIYLQGAVNAGYQSEHAAQWLQSATLILQADPYRRGISDVERNVRLQVAFSQAGRRLDNCTSPADADSQPPPLPTDLVPLKAKWKQMEPKVTRMDKQPESGLLDAIMDLVFQIEEEAQFRCGPPQALDQALVTISRDPSGVDR